MSYVLIGTLVLMLLPYLWPSLRYNRHEELRSLSGIICQLRPFGHFFMSLGNLLLFLILSLDDEKIIAWLHWATLQLVLSFDVDEFPKTHFVSLAAYIALLFAFWAQTCKKYDFWTEAIPLFVTTGLFVLLMAYHVALFGCYSRWRFQSLQSVLELSWIACNVYLVFTYENFLREEHGIKPSVVF